MIKQKTISIKYVQKEQCAHATPDGSVALSVAFDVGVTRDLTM